MENIAIPADTVPADLKAACEQTLKRAVELKKVEPVIAYWCSFWAAQKALKAKDDPSLSVEERAARKSTRTKFLMALLDALEAMKTALGDSEAVTNEAVGAAYVEAFALKVFMSADNADRAGDFGKATIRKFAVARQFIEVLECFEGGMSEEMKQKDKYAKWKAADLARCLREGRTPVAGPPQGEADDLALFPSLGGVSSDPETGRRDSTGSAASPRPGSADSRRGSASSLQPPSAPARQPSPLSQRDTTTPNIPALSGSPPSESAQWSTLAASGGPVSDAGGDEDADAAAVRRELGGTSPPPLSSPGTAAPAPTLPSAPPTFPGLPAEAPSAPPPLDSPPSRNVRFSDLDDVSGHADVGASPPSPSGGGITGLPPARPPSLPPTSFHTSPPPPPSVPSAPPSAPSAPPLAPSAPPSIPSAPRSFTAPAQPPSAPPAPTGPARELSRKETEQCQKHCRWAISALEFEDPETARLELLKALAMLT